MASTHLMLVRDRRARTHSLVRLAPIQEAGRLATAPDAERLNKLAMARTPTALVEAAWALGPLFRQTDPDGAITAPRLLGADELIGLVSDGTLARPDPQSLIRECVLDPLWSLGDDGTFRREGRVPAADARRAASDLGPSLRALAEDYGEDDTAVFALEPLQDWVLARNLMSIAMRICALSRRDNEAGDGGADVLARAGFVEVRRTSFASLLALSEQSALVIPVAFNAWHRNGSVLANDLQYPSGLIHPLLDSICEWRRGKAGMRSYRRLKGSGEGDMPDIRILDAASANVPPGEDGGASELLYLALQGDDQRALADHLVRSLDDVLCRRTASPRAYTGGSVPYGFPTVAGALWDRLMRHDGLYLMTCKECGRTVLSTSHGPRREFCSDTCRAAFNKRARDARDRQTDGT